jgi:hypothetical protein
VNIERGSEAEMLDRDDLPDDVPIGDADEQQRELAAQPAAPEQADAPIEADPTDWQEQLREVGGDGELDEYQ